MSKIAIIGTAGRDKTKPMTHRLWNWMVADAKSRTGPGDHLVSGGAAWADHLAVQLFLDGHVKALTLHLPAPFANGVFIGPYRSAASAANYYHQLFSNELEVNTLSEIELAASMPNCDGTFEQAAEGYGAMFARNKKVAAAADLLLAYTFGEGDVPADGGTKDTWDQCKGKRIHISLPMSFDDGPPWAL